MKFIEKLKDSFTAVDEEETEMEFDEVEARALSDYEEPKNKEMAKIATNTKMVLFEPRSFEEAEEVARHLKARRAAVVNLHKLQREYSQRTIDFLSGVVFALDGTIQKIGHNVILCTPSTIGVQGQINFDANEE